MDYKAMELSHASRLAKLAEEERSEIKKGDKGDANHARILDKLSDEEKKSAMKSALRKA